MNAELSIEGEKMKDDGLKEIYDPLDDDLLYEKLIFESIPVGIICISPERKIMKFNPQAERITGYKAEESLGLFCGDILHGEYCLSNCPIQTVLKKEKQVVHVETTIRTRHNNILPVAMTTAAMFDNKGKLIGAVEALEDISRIKRLEKERFSLISMVAHDMKSPLACIGGFSTLLMHKERERLSAQQMKYLDIIKNETEKLDSMVNEMVEISRLETGQLKLDISSTSIDKVLIDLFEIYHPRIAEKGLELALDLNGNSPMILADEMRLKRVLGSDNHRNEKLR